MAHERGFKDWLESTSLRQELGLNQGAAINCLVVRVVPGVPPSGVSHWQARLYARGWFAPQWVEVPPEVTLTPQERLAYLGPMAGKGGAS